MKKLMTAAAVAALVMGSAPAFAAAGTSQTYNFDATVAARCEITGASIVHFGALTTTDGSYTAGSTAKTATDSDAYCNQAGTTVDISHSDLQNVNSATAGFTNVVAFTPSLSTDQGVTLGEGSGQAINAFSGLSVTATLSPPADKLVAGTYNGSITVTLHPHA